MKRKARILIVDDEQGVRSGLERVLEREYEVITAASCEETRSLLAAELIDLAVVDLVLPDGDGFTLLEELRQRREQPEVIVITGDPYEVDENLARALRAHAFYFLTKPFDAVALEALVKRSLEVRGLQRALRQRSEELERDLKLAREFQARLMPRRDLRHRDVTLSYHFEPCAELAGDFVDYRAVDGRVLFLVADVMGHGLTAAMLVGMVAAAWSRAVRNRFALKEIHAALVELVEEWDDHQFVTVLLGSVDVARGRLEYINSGHPSPILREPSGETQFLPGKIPMISPALEGVVAEACEAPFPRGARLLCFTDGLVETRNPEGDELGIEPVLQILEAHPVKPLPALRQRLAEHHAGRPVEDDVTMLWVARSAAERPPPR